MASATQTPDGKHYVEYEEYVDFQLEKTRANIKLNDILTTLAALGVAILGYLLAFVVLDQWIIPGGFGYGARVALLAVLASGVLGILARRVLWPILRRVHPIYAARVIERSDPKLKSNLVNFVDVRQANMQSAPVVLKAMQKRAAVELSHIDVEQAVDRRPLLRIACALLAVVVVSSLYIVLSPKDAFSSIRRALLPTAPIAVATETTIDEVEPGDVQVAARSHPAVKAMVRGKAVDHVEIQFTTADHKFVDQPVPMKRPTQPGSPWEGQLNGDNNGKGLLQSLTYRIVAGDARTRDYTITVIQPPSAHVDEIHYVFPSYMQLEQKTTDGGPIDGWEGALVALNATANMPVKTAKLILTDSEDRSAKGEEYRMQVTDGTKLSQTIKLEFRQDGTSARFYHIEVETADNKIDPDPTYYTYRVRPDQRPEVALLAPSSSDLTMPANGIIPLVIQAADPDFLLRSITLKAERNGDAFPDRRLFDDQVLGQAFRGDYEFRLEPLRLNEGDTIQFWIEAKDNKQPTANRANTPRINVHIGRPVKIEEVEEALAEEKKKQKEQLGEAKNQLNDEGDQDAQEDVAGDGKEDAPSQRADQVPDEPSRKVEKRPLEDEAADPAEPGNEEEVLQKDPLGDQQILERLLEKQRREQAQQQQEKQQERGQEEQQQDAGEESSGGSQENESNRSQPSKSQGNKQGKSGNDGKDPSSDDPSQQPQDENRSATGEPNREGGKQGEKSAKPQAQGKEKNGDKQHGEKGDDPREPGDRGEGDAQPQKRDTEKGTEKNAEKTKPGAGDEQPEEAEAGAEKPVGGEQKSDKPGDKNSDDKPGSDQKPGDKQPGKEGDANDNAGGNKNDKHDKNESGMPDDKNSEAKQDKGKNEAGSPQKEDGDNEGADDRSASGTEGKKQRGSGKEENDKADAAPDSKDESANEGGGEKSQKSKTDKPAGNGAGEETKKQGAGKDTPGDKADVEGEEKPADDSPDAKNKQATGKQKGKATGSDETDPRAPKAENDLEPKDGGKSGSKKRSESSEPPPKGTQKRRGEEGTKNSSPDAENADRPSDGKKPEQEPPELDEDPSPRRDDIDKGDPAENRPEQQPDAGNRPLKGPGRKKGEQRSQQPETGEVGKSAASDEGKKGANKTGAGDKDAQPGDDDPASQETGHPGDKQGKGSTTKPSRDKEGKKQAAAGENEGGQASPEGGERQEQGESGKPGQGESGQKPSAQKGKGKAPGKEGQSGEGQSDDGDSGDQDGNQGGSGKPANPKSGKSQNAPGDPGAPGNGSGTSKSGNGVSSQPGDGNGPADGAPNDDETQPPPRRQGSNDDLPPTPEEEEANLEYARKATNLVLQKLKSKLERGEVDQELLDEMGWKNKGDVERFVKFLEQGLNAEKDDSSPEAVARRLQFEETLKNINTGTQTEQRAGSTGQARTIRQTGAKNVPVPSEWLKQYGAYTRSLSKQPDSARDKSKSKPKKAAK